MSPKWNGDERRQSDYELRDRVLSLEIGAKNDTHQLNGMIESLSDITKTLDLIKDGIAERRGAEKLAKIVLGFLAGGLGFLGGSLGSIFKHG